MLATRAMRRLSLSLLYVLLLMASPPPGHAQAPGGTGRTATLAGWAEQVRADLLDRRHAYGGLFFDRGLFRRFTRYMDHEYDIDLATYGFTPQEDAPWYRSAHAYRGYMGSINKSRFATRHHFRHQVPFGAGHQVRLQGIMQEDLRAERFLVAFGYSYGWRPGQRVGFSQTVASYKPDLDFTLFYEAGDPLHGFARVDVTALDVANNLIFDVIDVDPDFEDTTRSYRRRPWLLAVQLASPEVHGVRGELSAGVQPRARAAIGSKHAPNNRFSFADRASYLGGLLEYRRPQVTVGLLLQRTASEVARGAPPGSNYTSDYAGRQVERTVTVYALASLGTLRLEAWLGRGRYADEQQGTDYDQALLPAELDFREQRTTARLIVRQVPRRQGVRYGVAYLAYDRAFNEDYEVLEQYLRFKQNELNHRVVAQVGYQLRRGVGLLTGMSFDLDGDVFTRKELGPVRYDGGFARLTVVW